MWWDEHQAYYQEQRLFLSQNSNYKEKTWALDQRLISSGVIHVRGSHSGTFPIVIIYPDATPYQGPQIFLLEEVLSQDEVNVAASDPNTLTAISIAVRKRKIYFTRHQNLLGSLCILETDDLHSEQPEILSIDKVIKRVMDWCRGTLTNHFPLDTNEFELIQHFHRHALGLNFIISDAFFEEQIIEGDFFFEKIPGILNESFYGAGIIGKTKSAVIKNSFGHTNSIDRRLTVQKDNWIKQDKTVTTAIAEQRVIQGKWWSLDSEPSEVVNKQTFFNLFRDETSELRESWLRELEKPLKDADPFFYVGIRYPNRKNELEWSFFKFINLGISAAISAGATDLEVLKQQIEGYELEAIALETMTEAKFHVRNQGRVGHDRLKELEVTFFGLGALGSTLALQFAKAGLGRLKLFDKDRIQTHNLIRHQASLKHVHQSKPEAIAEMIENQNPFVSSIGYPQHSTYTLKPEEWRTIVGDQIAISSIADDNTEGYMNELAMLENTTMYYVRALRGGKAARIFRVIPGVDACKECLTHYFSENHPDFIDVPEDPNLPIITNECNNPIRPASAADLELISSLTSRLVLDELQQTTPQESNHWVWTTEQVEGLPYEASTPFQLHQRSLKPHPNCRLCSGTKIRGIRIYKEVTDFIFSRSLTSSPKETGGVLVGYMKHGVMYIVGASDAGPESTKKLTLFVRDTEYCQDYLNRYYEKTKGLVRYIGEWHSHPTQSVKPSQTDINSLKDIANQHEYTVNEVVSIIVSKAKELGVSIHQQDGSYKYITLLELSGAWKGSY